MKIILYTSHTRIVQLSTQKKMHILYNYFMKSFNMSLIIHNEKIVSI